MREGEILSAKKQMLLNGVMVLLAWSSLFFIGGRNIKRFLPASVLIVIIEAIHVQMGKRRKWWFFYNKPSSYFFNEFPFNIGPFLVGSMWILKWSYGNFKKFLLINTIVDGGFAFIMTNVFKRLRIFTLDRFSKMQLFIYFYFKAFLLYGSQYIYDKKVIK